VAIREKWASGGGRLTQFLHLSFVDSPADSPFDLNAAQHVETAMGRALTRQRRQQEEAGFRAAAQAVARLRARRRWGDKPLWVGPNDAWECQSTGDLDNLAQRLERHPGVPLGTFSSDVGEWPGCVAVRFHTSVVPVNARLDAEPADRFERHIDLVLVQLRDGDLVAQGWMCASTLELRR
jgi:hypothetical protein